MAQASYDWQVFDLECVEDALVIILRNSGIENVYGKRSSDVRETPCVELNLQTEAVQGQRYNRFTTINASLVQPYNTFGFTLRAKITSNRAENGSQHRQLLARTRFNLQYYRLTQTYTETVSPYHSITDIRESSAPNEIENELNLDLTELTFTGMLNIRDGAWPTNIS